MPSEVSDIKQFIEICRRKDASCMSNLLSPGLARRRPPCLGTGPLENLSQAQDSSMTRWPAPQSDRQEINLAGNMLTVPAAARIKKTRGTNQIKFKGSPSLMYPRRMPRASVRRSRCWRRDYVEEAEGPAEDKGNENGVAGSVRLCICISNEAMNDSAFGFPYCAMALFHPPRIRSCKVTNVLHLGHDLWSTPELSLHHINMFPGFTTCPEFLPRLKLGLRANSLLLNECPPWGTHSMHLEIEQADSVLLTYETRLRG
ncbi:hypothetical protein FH972_021453 [Carpinus fangiana]|uniref:Uncharacterized protein n=1 Tax=Carpinus fangiana TaxID=176857 RepID=A0A5N6KPY7_9ROSI|nr:hypothetical protein FH972_021453 [Carpinus fangiana]